MWNHRKRPVSALAAFAGLFLILVPVAPAAAARHIVTSSGDDGTGSLRQAIASAAEGDTIVFSRDVGAVSLAADPDRDGIGLLIDKHLTIDGGRGVAIARSGDAMFSVLGIAEGKAVRLSHLTIRGGKHEYYGGGIQNEGDLTLNHCVIAENETSYLGGGINNDRGTLTMSYCTIHNNLASDGPLGAGGGGINNTGTMTLDGCTVSGNETAGHGGGIRNGTRSEADITNCTISGNSASGHGGALLNSANRHATLVNCTIADNTAEAGGGGVYQVERADQILNLSNTILSNTELNYADDYDPRYGLPYVVTRTHTISSDGTVEPYTGSGNRDNTDPILGVLRGNGGVTLTRALLPGSPAINGGTADNAPHTDQRGVPRYGPVDIGAYEFSRQMVYILGDMDGNGIVGVSDIIHGLKTSSGIARDDGRRPPGSDVDRDGRIGLADVIHTMQMVSGVRISDEGDAAGLSLDRIYRDAVSVDDFHEDAYYYQTNLTPGISAHQRVTLLSPDLSNPGLRLYLDDGNYVDLDADGKGGIGGRLCVSADLVAGSVYQIQVRSDNTGPLQLFWETGQCSSHRGVAACGDRSAFYAAGPLDPDSYDSITPLGNLNPPGHTFPTVHTYMMLADITEAVPVYTPGDVTVTSVVSYEHTASGLTEYSITFYSCAEVYGYYHHIAILTDDMLNRIGPFRNCQDLPDLVSCTADVFIEYGAGTLIGYAGGPEGTGVAALDFGARDRRIDPIFYVSQGKFVSTDSNEMFVVCPYEYYEAGAVKEVLLSKLQEARSAEPICGTVALDAANTAQGRWYLVGSSWDSSSGAKFEADHLALVPSNFDPTVGVVSVGNADVGPGAYFFDMTESGLIRRDFLDVTGDGLTYCYDELRDRTDRIDTEGPGTGNSDPLPGYFYLQMQSNSTLTIEKVDSGLCPGDPNTLSFTGAAVAFER